MRRIEPDKLREIFEHAPWVAERALKAGPFASVAALHDAMMQAVAGATPSEQLALIRAHPELAARQASPLTANSQAEQAGAGITTLSEDERARFAALNAAYREKFGFPFIICVKQHGREAILEAFERRLGRDVAAERQTALEQIAAITKLRLEALFA